MKKQKNEIHETILDLMEPSKPIKIGIYVVSELAGL